MITVKNITKYFGEQRVLNNVSFVLDKGHKVALTGFNGTGKTTLLKMISGEVPVEKGKIEINKNIKIGMLPQDPGQYDSLKVIDFLTEGLHDYKGKEAHFYRDIEVMFAGFGLESKIKDKKIRGLSSGQKTKIFLTSILLKNADVLLLDEPTNNLDLPALIWLEQYLKNTELSFIVVSHDKVFLDNVANKVFEIDWKTRRLEIINGKYSDYLLQKRKENERTLKKHELQKYEIIRLRDLVKTKIKKAEAGAKHVTKDNDHMLQGYRRNKAGDSLKDAMILKKRINRMDIVEKPEERKSFNIEIKPEDLGQSRDISTKRLICGYDDGFFVGPIDLDLVFGSRTIILGLNGTGKSTILKTITGTIPKKDGELLVGEGVKFGNLMQEHSSLNKEETLFQYLKKRTDNEDEIIYNHLKHFGFEPEQVHEKIFNLSPGGRARLLLSYFSVTNVNVLVLDEPTNHLDLEAEEALEKTLQKFEGTVSVVTHNRSFVEKFSQNSSIYVLQDRTLNKIYKFADYVAEMEKSSKKLLRMLGCRTFGV